MEPNLPQKFRDCASYVEKHGWTQKRKEGPGGSVCVWGALEKLFTDAGMWGEPYNLFLRSNDIRSMIVFNDSLPAKSGKERVIEAFLKAADYCEPVQVKVPDWQALIDAPAMARELTV